MTGVARHLLWIAALGIGLPACRHADDTTTTDALPCNVVLVVLDSVRADHVGAYGYALPTTPHLDALAANGVVFERAWAASSSGQPSLAALWTGRLPTNGGSTDPHAATPHAELVTLPRAFLGAGFRTGLASNHTGLRDRAFTRGFEQLELDSSPGRWSGELVTNKALDILDELRTDPFLLVVELADAREPHLPPGHLRARFRASIPPRPLTLDDLRAQAGALDEDVTRSPGFLDLVARYDAEIARVDACLGRIVDGLRERGLLDRTLLIVTSTHGVEWLEHGGVGSGWTLHEEVLRVPLVLHAPGRLAPARVSRPVSLVDVLPSLREVCGLARSDPASDGRSLLTRRAGGWTAAAPTGVALAELLRPGLCELRAVIREDEKLIRVQRDVAPRARASALARSADEDSPDAEGRHELYDLASDPGERLDLGSTAFDRMAELARLLDDYERLVRLHGLAAPRAVPATERENAQLDELRSLGYL